MNAIMVNFKGKTKPKQSGFRAYGWARRRGVQRLWLAQWMESLKFQTMTFSAKKASSGYAYSAPLIWSLAMIIFGAVAAITFFLCRLYLRRSDYKHLPTESMNACASNINEHLEREQLTATTQSRYDMWWQQQRGGTVSVLWLSAGDNSPRGSCVKLIICTICVWYFASFFFTSSAAVHLIFCLPPF